jgi:hypothetical protein
MDLTGTLRFLGISRKNDCPSRTKAQSRSNLARIKTKVQLERLTDEELDLLERIYAKAGPQTMLPEPG